MSILLRNFFNFFRGELMLTYETIKKLCKDNGVTVTGLEKELGISRGSLCKVNTNKPSIEKAQKIADFFGVSVEYLMTGEEKEEPTIYYTNEETASFAQKLFEDDKVLFDVYRSSDKERLVEYAKRLKALRDMEGSL